MHGWEAIPLNKGQLEKMEVIPNKVLRMDLSMLKRTAIEYLRGEMGISSVGDKDCKNKMELLRHCMQKTVKLRKLLEENWNKKVEWIEICKEYLNKIELEKSKLEKMSKKDLIKYLDDRWNEKWKQDMKCKKSLKWYMEIKESYEGNKMWKSNEEDRIKRWFQAGVVMKPQFEYKLCENCNEEIYHLLLECDGTEDLRLKYNVDQSIQSLLQNKSDSNKGVFLIEAYKRINEVTKDRKERGS